MVMRVFAIGSGSATATTGLTVAGATTLIFVNPKAAPNPDIDFLRYSVGQGAATPVNQMQRIQLVTQVTAFPTLTGATPRPLKLSDPNASVIVSGTAGAAGTSGINASAEGAGAKTAYGIIDDSFNLQSGYLFVATPEQVITMPSGFASGLGLWFPNAGGTTTGWNFSCIYREEG